MHYFTHARTQDVPNALVFIDKYTQVPRIITPLLNVIESIDHVAELPGQRDYIEVCFSLLWALCAGRTLALRSQRKFGSTENCKAAILQDFFKYGFDGSGSDGGMFCVLEQFKVAFLLPHVQSFQGAVLMAGLPPRGTGVPSLRRSRSTISSCCADSEDLTASGDQFVRTSMASRILNPKPQI